MGRESARPSASSARTAHTERASTSKRPPCNCGGPIAISVSDGPRSAAGSDARLCSGLAGLRLQGTCIGGGCREHCRGCHPPPN
eukprot:108794-Alexandrium_andersonii.AAC.1